MSDCTSLPLVSPISPFGAVLCVYWRLSHGHLRCLPAAKLGVEVGRAAGDDCCLLTADGGLLHLTLCPLRRGSPQHRVSRLLRSFNLTAVAGRC